MSAIIKEMATITSRQPVPECNIPPTNGKAKKSHVSQKEDLECANQHDLYLQPPSRGDGNRPGCESSSDSRHTLEKSPTPSSKSHKSQTASEKSYKRGMTPEEFDFETRYVVLNFLGLVPVSNHSLNASSGTSSSEDNLPSHLHSQISLESSRSGLSKHTKRESGEWSALPKLPEMTISEKFHEHDAVDYSKMNLFSQGDVVISAGKKKSPSRWRQIDDATGQTRKTSKQDTLNDAVYGLSSQHEEAKIQVDVEDDSDSLPEPTQSLDLLPAQQIKSEVGGASGDGEEGDDFRRSEVPGSNTVSVSQNNVHEPSGKPNSFVHAKSGVLSRDLTAHVNGNFKHISRSIFDRSNSLQKPGDSAPGGDSEDEVDALPWAADTHHMATAVPSAAQRPTSIDISKHVYPPVSPTPSLPHRSKSPGKWQKSPLTKSYTVDSDRSTSSSRPEYTWQLSQRSESSSLSEPDSLMHSIRSHSSTKSVRIDVTALDVQVVAPLVDSKVLPDLTTGLKHELDEQMHELENRSGSSLQSVAHSMSPESQIAAYLSQIGDRVQARHGEQLDRAFQYVTSQPREVVGYDEFRNVAGELTQGVSGVTKVALLLLFGKRLAYNLLSKGDRGINKVVDYTAKLIEDQAADFIIEKGGWNSIKDLDNEWSPTLSVYDVEQGIGQGYPDSLSEQPAMQGLGDAIISSSVPTTTNAAMTESYHSDTTDTTLVGDMRMRDQSLDSLCNLTAVSEASPADSLDSVPFEQYSGQSRTNLESLPGSRHASSSSMRRGSFNFVPYPDHVLQVSGTVASEDNNNSSVFEERDAGLGSRPSFDSETDMACASGCEGQCNDANHALVEGTLDVDISRDVLLLRQLSKELAEESEQARERQSYYNNVAVAVAVLAVVIVGAVCLYRKNKQ